MITMARNAPKTMKVLLILEAFDVTGENGAMGFWGSKVIWAGMIPTWK
ncbi:MAG: hypothetical protein CM1200mP12_06300 [Gammaproteobacteria bacterium]|nr:MAG: hypothetical protein CM1200mP12_06300 [Gammaproteobacteria bacterium]